VAAALPPLAGAEPAAVVEHVARSALDWSAAANHDDIAILALRAEPPEGSP
jgi:hypothetical protein